MSLQVSHESTFSYKMLLPRLEVSRKKKKNTSSYTYNQHKPNSWASDTNQLCQVELEYSTKWVVI